MTNKHDNKKFSLHLLQIMYIFRSYFTSTASNILFSYFILLIKDEKITKTEKIMFFLFRKKAFPKAAILYITNSKYLIRAAAI